MSLSLLLFSLGNKGRLLFGTNVTISGRNVPEVNEKRIYRYFFLDNDEAITKIIITFVAEKIIKN